MMILVCGFIAIIYKLISLTTKYFLRIKVAVYSNVKSDFLDKQIILGLYNLLTLNKRGAEINR